MSGVTGDCLARRAPAISLDFGKIEITERDKMIGKWALIIIAALGVAAGLIYGGYILSSACTTPSSYSWGTFMMFAGVGVGAAVPAMLVHVGTKLYPEKPSEK